MSRRWNDIIYIEQRLANRVRILSGLEGHLPGNDPQRRVGSYRAPPFQPVKITFASRIYFARVIMRTLFPVDNGEAELLVFFRRNQASLNPHIDPAVIIGCLCGSRQVHPQPATDPAQFCQFRHRQWSAFSAAAAQVKPHQQRIGRQKHSVEIHLPAHRFGQFAR